MAELEDKYPLNIGFDLPPKDGTLDIAIRYDTVDGHYNYRIEENGIPVTVPAHVLTGILMNIILASANQ